MRRGFYVLPDEDDVRVRAVRAGFEALQYQPQPVRTMCQLAKQQILSQDVAISWSLWAGSTRWRIAEACRRVGARVFCLETGWCQFIRGMRYYQLAERIAGNCGTHGHGVFPVGSARRFDQWGLEMLPWRKSGNHILVCSQKGKKEGSLQITHAADWADNLMRRLRQATDRPILWRPHPKTGPLASNVPRQPWPGLTLADSRQPVEEQLAGAWCCVVYTSTVFSTALLRGIPVCYDAPRICCQEAMTAGVARIEKPALPERLPVFRKWAWCNWNAEEIASGSALRHLLLGR